MTPSWVVRERVACPFTAQMPRNSATELSTTSFFLIILAGKGDIPEVVDQLKPLEDLHFHLNHENGNGRERLEAPPPQKKTKKKNKTSKISMTWVSEPSLTYHRHLAIGDMF